MLCQGTGMWWLWKAVSGEAVDGCFKSISSFQGLLEIVYSFLLKRARDCPAFFGGEQGITLPSSAESKGFDAVFALLRRKNCTELLPQLPSLKTVHRTVFLTLRPFRVRIPCPTNKKKRRRCNVSSSFHGGEQGIRTLETAVTVYTISSRAPSASSDNSPYGQMWCISVECENYYIRRVPEKQVLFLSFGSGYNDNGV